MRGAELYISYGLIKKLRAAADLLELPNAETVAEIWLNERLQQMPEVEQLITEQSKSSAKIRAEWKEKQNKSPIWGIPIDEPPRS